jgi:tRNA pseudouridine38-40 synthase
MYRYKINVEYDGSKFSGWQKQDDVLTIQGVIEEAIEKLTQIKTEVVGAGRTDSGVHAISQVAHFDLPKELTMRVINQGLNYYLKKFGISIYGAEFLGENSTFHARFSAKKRTYIYKIINRDYPLTFEKNLYWFIPKSLDVKKMQESSHMLIGTNDLSTFRASGCQALSPIKTINSISIEKVNSYITIIICAPSFLYHQVRNIVGALYFVGCGKWSIADFAIAFKSCDRTKGAITAPACGLYFYHVEY